jgi:hypothetical protein
MKNTIRTLPAFAAATMLALPALVLAQAMVPATTLPPVPAAQSETADVASLSGRMSAAAAMSVLAGDPAAADVLAGEDALSEVSIDVNPTDPDNQVIVGHDTDLVTMNTFYTTDGGLTWSPVIIGNSTDGLTSDFRFDPTVAFDDDGNVYVGYGAKTARPEGGNQRTVVVCRSTDGGASYPQCTNIATTADIGDLPGNDKWHLATGPDPSIPTQQNVYIPWTQNITEGGSLDQRIVVSRSTDGGATFSAPVTINDPSIAGTRSGNLFADPAVGPGGEVYVVWHDIDAGEVWIDTSLDGGLTFGTDVLVTNSAAGFKTKIPAQPDRGVGVMPTIDTDRSGGPFNGRIYLAYSDLGAGGAADFDVLVRSSGDGGLTWTAPVVVHDDGGTNSQFLPWVDVDQQTGQVVAVWYDARNDANNKKVEVFLAVSDDGGATWKPNMLISESPSDMSVDNASRYLGNFLEYIGVASLGGTAFPVWADNSESPGDLDYFTDQIPIGTAPECDANGPYTAECGLPVKLDGSGSSDPDGGALTFAWTGPFQPSPSAGATPTVVFDSPTGDKVVSLTVTDPDSKADSCEAMAKVQDTLAPYTQAPDDVTAECTSPAGTPVNLGTPIVGDECDANPSVSNDAPPLFPLGTTTVNWIATDADGNQGQDTQSVLVEDTTPPKAFCNSPAKITPADAPISFTATATDTCGTAQARVVAYDCYAYTKKGKRIDKTYSCMVAFGGDTVTVLDSGGVGNFIAWTVEASDENGNSTTVTCDLQVVNPAQ